MNVFIGWSGDRSKQAALALRNWLPKVIQAVTPWMSEWDIKAGARWLVELLEQLEKTNFGIIALTSDNIREPWIHFEAGALAKQVKESKVCPYLIDITDKSAVAGPLAQFQIKRANQVDTLSLLKDINQGLGNDKLSDVVLTETFELWWPDLEKAFRSLPIATAEEPQRNEHELLEEILERVRSLDLQTSASPKPLVPPRSTRGSTVLTRWFAKQPDLSDEEIWNIMDSLRKRGIWLFEEPARGRRSTEASKPTRSEGEKSGGTAEES